MPYKKCPCGKQPIFNLPKGKPISCSACKTPEMIDVRHKRCICGNRPNFNLPGGNPIGCSECKTHEMLNVVNKRCSCGKIPSFNMPGESVGVYCSKCKTDDMINVVNKKCPCGKRPIFNLPREKIGICCKLCKTDEMIDVKNTRCPCGKRPVFNVTGQTDGICCARCKTGEMINVIDKICPGYATVCPVRTYLSNGNDYCMICDPNDARRKMFKRYEEAFFDYVLDKLDVHQREFKVSFDPSETAKKYARIDGIVFGDGVVVCIEVDENGHRDYECEEHRMHLVTAELLQKYPDHVVSWVRVNPTIKAKNQWDKKSKTIREKRFDDVVMKVLDILETKNITLVYIPDM